MPNTITADLALALKTLQDKQNHAACYQAAYDGENDLPVIADRLKSIFQGLKTEDVRQNWCHVVIEACADRITLNGFNTNDKAAQEALDTIIAQTDLLLEADDAHKHALITGAAYIVAWRDDATDDGSPIDVYFHEYGSAHVFYEAARPNVPRFACKWWYEDEADNGGIIYLKLYYKDGLYTYATNSKTKLQDAKPDAFELVEDGELPNPYNTIPVFELRPNRRYVKSDLHDVLPLQNAINMMFVNELVASEFNAVRQKYIISQADVSNLAIAPNTILNIPAGDGMGQATSVGEFSETNLSNFANGIMNKVQAIAAISRTPMHYFQTAGGTPSGEALIALEAPLNKKAQDRIDRFEVVWKRVASFLLLLSGLQVASEDIAPRFDKPETVQPRTAAEITQMDVKSGMPLAAALRLRGLDDAQIAQIEADKQHEQQANQAALGNALRNFNAGNTQGVQNGG